MSRNSTVENVIFFYHNVSGNSDQNYLEESESLKTNNWFYEIRTIIRTLQIVICVFGLIGNGFNVVIFAKRKRTSTDIILLTLSIADSAFLGGILCIVTASVFEIFSESLYGILNFPILTAQTLSILVISLLSLERHFVVCYPLKARQTCTRKNACYAVAVLALASVGAHIAIRLVNFLSERHLGESWSLSIIVKESITCLVNIIVPVAVIIYSNMRILMKLATARRIRASLTRRSLEQTQITRSLLLIFAIFLLSHVVYIAHQVTHYIGYVVPPYGYPAAYVLYALNSAVNFPVYVLTVKQFRNELAKLLCCNTH